MAFYTICEVVMMEFKVAEKCQLHAALLNAPIEYSKDGYMVTITAITAVNKPKTKSQRDSFHLWCGLLARCACCDERGF